MKTIGIIGYGYVGQAIANLLCDHYTILIYDPFLPEGDLVGGSRVLYKDLINKWCDVSFVCVPTPSDPRGCADTSIVEEAVGWCSSPLIIIKSTVSPGTTDRLREKTGKRIVFSPEYCGESSYWTPYAFHTDIKETPFFIFGGDKKDTSECVDLFLPVTGPVKTYRQTDAKSAEMAKYMENSFYATKITFCYEIAMLCRETGIDFNEVRELWLLDPRINPMHTAVFKGNSKPFSGKCLPKDTAALVAYGRSHGNTPQLLQEVLDSNERIGKVWNPICESDKSKVAPQQSLPNCK